MGDTLMGKQASVTYLEESYMFLRNVVSIRSAVVDALLHRLGLIIDTYSKHVFVYAPHVTGVILSLSDKENLLKRLQSCFFLLLN